MQNLTQTQIDRYNAFESMLDMMDPAEGYTKDEILATVDQLVEMAVEDRWFENHAPKQPKAEPVEDQTPRTDIDVRMHMAQNGWEQPEIHHFLEWAGNRDRTEEQWYADIEAYKRFIA